MMWNVKTRERRFANRRKRIGRRFRNGHEKQFGSFEQEERLNGEGRTRNDMERNYNVLLLIIGST